MFTLINVYPARLVVNERSTIAYKGGHYEKDLLKHIHVPSINLEDFGCPKAEFLFDQLVWLETCGNHLGAHAYNIVRKWKSKHSVVG